MTISFRPATPGDEPLVARFIRGIAEAEGELGKLVASEADYAAMLFGPDPPLRGLFALWRGEPAGMALWHWTGMTYQGRIALWLDDLCVDPNLRNKGVGRALMAELARLSQARGGSRIYWSVHRDNEAGAAFYQRLGAERLDEIMTYRLAGAALTELSAEQVRG